MKLPSKALVAVLAVLVLAALAYLGWQKLQSALPAHEQRVTESVQPIKPVQIAAPEAAPVAATPIRHPIEEATEQVQAPASKPAPLPTLAESDKLLKESLTELLTRKSVLTFLNMDEFIRHFVATVDNLALGHAAARLWPVVPSPGRFMVVERADGPYLDEHNSERYTPFVRFATSVDTAKAAALYARLYPLFQQAYEELGYPGKYFNDRLVAVIDQLLDTPELSEPIKLTLTQVQGTVPSSQPWLRYEFDDPALEARPAGQKILMRMGRSNELLLKAKLKEFRERIVKRKSSR
jgi:Protein of unknown function (DUF3014)